MYGLSDSDWHTFIEMVFSHANTYVPWSLGRVKWNLTLKILEGQEKVGQIKILEIHENIEDFHP